jgi:hypothetical protein
LYIIIFSSIIYKLFIERSILVSSHIKRGDKLVNELETEKMILYYSIQLPFDNGILVEPNRILFWQSFVVIIAKFKISYCCFVCSRKSCFFRKKNGNIQKDSCCINNANELKHLGHVWLQSNVCTHAWSTKYRLFTKLKI